MAKKKLDKNILSKNIKKPYCLKCSIAVSGAAKTDHCALGANKKAEEIGREIARQGMILTTGATVGLPYWAAKGAKAEGGLVIGLSPASSESSHLKTYKLPIDYHDIIIYTGFEYAGRNLLLTRSADAVIIICGRIGTLNEFTVAYEYGVPIGILEGTGGMADMIKQIVKRANKGPGKIIFSRNPKELVVKLAKMVAKEKARNNK